MFLFVGVTGFPALTKPLLFWHNIMAKTREQIHEERRRLKAEYGSLFDSVAALLFRHDPMRITFDDLNTYEYEPEAGTILPRLRECKSANDVVRVVHEEFARWFGPDAGTESAYTEIAAEIWELVQKNRKDGNRD